MIQGVKYLCYCQFAVAQQLGRTIFRETLGNFSYIDILHL